MLTCICIPRLMNNMDFQYCNLGNITLSLVAFLCGYMGTYSLNVLPAPAKFSLMGQNEHGAWAP